VVIGTT